MVSRRALALRQTMGPARRRSAEASPGSGGGSRLLASTPALGGLGHPARLEDGGARLAIGGGEHAPDDDAGRVHVAVDRLAVAAAPLVPSLDDLHIQPAVATGHTFAWDEANSKVKAFSGGVEIANATDITTAVARFEASGKPMLEDGG
jgi:hypothetical protein